MDAGAELLARGQAASATHSHYPKPVYLPRTLRRAFRQMMGSAASSQQRHKSSPSTSNIQSIEDESMGDTNERAAKRRKVYRSPARLSASIQQDGNVSEPAVTSIAEMLVFPKPSQFGESVRIDILQIVENGVSKQNRMQPWLQHDEPIEIECTVEICNAEILEENGRQKIKKKEQRVQVSSLGKLLPIFSEDGQRSLRVILDDGPFLIPIRRLRVWKAVANAAPEHKLDDYYNVRIWLSPWGPSVNLLDWPPVKVDYDTGIPSLIERSSQRLMCSKSLFEMYQNPDQKVDLKLNTGSSNDRLSLKSALHFNIRFSYPLKLKAPRRPAVPISGEFDNDGVTLTYSRQIRNIDGTITPDQIDFRGAGFFCGICSRRQPSWDFLRFHMKTEHDNFCFRFGRSEEDSSVYFVELSHTEDAITRSRIERDESREFHLNPPQKAFTNLDGYTEGDDDTWVKSRTGSGFRPGKKRVSSSVSSIQESQRSTPITSVDMDFENLLPKPRTRRRLVIPRIKQRLYHCTYKYELHPGDVLSNDDDDYDLKFNWQTARHKDVIHDFTDLTDDEKDYLVQWDSFVMRQIVTGNRFFPATLIQFMTENKTWFGERRSRGMEFGKHAMTLVLRDAIDEECLTQCCAILNTAAKEYEESAKLKDPKVAVTAMEPVWPPLGRRKYDCECGKPVLPAQSVICKGLNCTHRWYHLTCLMLESSPPDFRCPNCKPPDTPEILVQVPVETDAILENPISALGEISAPRFQSIRKTPPIMHSESVTRKVTSTVARKSGIVLPTGKPSSSLINSTPFQVPKPARQSLGQGFIPRSLPTDAGGPRFSPPGGRPRTSPFIPRSTPDRIDAVEWTPKWKPQSSGSWKQ